VLGQLRLGWEVRGRARPQEKLLAGRDRGSSRQKSLVSCSASAESLDGRGWGPGRVDPLLSVEVETCHLPVFSKFHTCVVVVRTGRGLPRTGGLGVIIDQLTRTKQVRELSKHRDDGIAKRNSKHFKRFDLCGLV